MAPSWAIYGNERGRGAAPPDYLLDENGEIISDENGDYLTS